MPRLWRLRWQLARAERLWNRDMEKARERKVGREKLEEIQLGWWADTDEIREEMETLQTRRLLRKAHRLDVPYPHRPVGNQQKDENWVQGSMTGSWFLTTTGINKVRSDIRTEIRARHEARGHWIAWISAITGLVGALTGLFAVLYGQ